MSGGATRRGEDLMVSRVAGGEEGKTQAPYPRHHLIEVDEVRLGTLHQNKNVNTGLFIVVAPT